MFASSIGAAVDRRAHAPVATQAGAAPYPSASSLYTWLAQTQNTTDSWLGESKMVPKALLGLTFATSPTKLACVIIAALSVVWLLAICVCRDEDLKRSFSLMLRSRDKNTGPVRSVRFADTANACSAGRASRKAWRSC